MRIQCSNCGAIKGFTYTATNVNKAIFEGWGSFGGALYCPKCVKTWGERNNTKLSSNENTIKLIDEVHERNKRK